MPWEQPLTKFKTYLLLERNLSVNTINAYLSDLNKLQQWSEINEIVTSPEKLSDRLLKRFVYEQATSLNARSQARLVSSLKQFFRHQIISGARQDNPMAQLETPQLGRKLPKVLSTLQIDRLLETVDNSTLEGKRNTIIIETLYGCGLRVSELLDLLLSNLFFEEGVVKVTGKGNKQRFIPMGSYLHGLLTDYINDLRPQFPIKKEHSDVLFLNRRGNKLTRAMIFHITKVLAQQSGIGIPVSPHTFRHSYASHLLENGADLRSIQALLGHESITTTEVYLHMDRSFLKKTVNTYHPRAFKNQ